jgi:hypothetical protein
VVPRRSRAVTIAPHFSTKPRTILGYRSKSRTTCSEEGENDGDITSSDMTILMDRNHQVTQSYIMMIFATFNELMLRHDVCALSFSEINAWIIKSVKHTWKAWRNKEVDWGPNPSIPTFPTRLPRHIWPRKERDQIEHVLESLDSDCRTSATCDGRHDFIRASF